MKFNPPTLSLSGTGLAAGAAAGMAAALLSMMAPQHQALSLVLGFVSPLPIMIAALAFGRWAGGLGVVVGAVFVAAFDMKLGHLVLVTSPGRDALADSLDFLVGLGLPAWLLTFLAQITARPARAGAAPPRMRPDELRLSRVVMAAVLFAVVAVTLQLGLEIMAQGGLAKVDAALVAQAEQYVRDLAEKSQSGLGAEQLHNSALVFAALEPWVKASSKVVFFLVNLWLAARIARTSGAFGDGWPDIPRNLRLPRSAALALAVSLGLSFTTSLVGLVSHIVSGALIAAFALQGLAVIHALTRGRTWRMPALAFTYLLVPLVFWAVLGLLDTAFSFRDRQTPVIKKSSERKLPWK